MNSELPSAGVPPRVVILSIVGVWLCYFVLVTLRGALVGFELNWEFVSRRLAVTVVSIVLTGALWPLLRALDSRTLGVKATAVLVGALPAAIMLAVINQWAFNGLDEKVMTSATDASNVHIRRDDLGNVFLDIPQPPPPPAPPAPAVDGSSSLPRSVTIDTSQQTRVFDARLAELADLASVRYFLLLAWAALYLALSNGEQLRAAERREGEFRRAAASAELRSLRYQVNPHFLFNTLNSLSALVMTGRTDDAETMIQTLSNFYRRTLSSDPTGDMTLVDEIALQQLYLDIETVRFPGRLLRVVELPPALAGAMVPGMILQPLVENSVKYAVALTSAPVTIAIAAVEEAGLLVLTVSDDGGGRDGAGIRSVAPKHGFGIGLGNVRDRLAARFGDAARLDAGPRPDGGFRTIIRMPVVRDDG